MRRSVIACLVLSLFLIGCGGDDDDADADTEQSSTDDGSSDGGSADDGALEDYRSEVADEMEGDPDFPLDEEQAACFAAAFVDTIGLEALEDADISPADLSSDEAPPELVAIVEDNRDDIAEAIAGCKLSAVLGTQLRDELGASEESMACVVAGIDEDEFAALLVAAAIGEEDAESGEAYGRDLMGNLDGPCAKRLVADVLVASGAIPEDAQQCVLDNISEDLAQRMFDPDEQVSSGEALQAELQAAMAPCAT